MDRHLFLLPHQCKFKMRFEKSNNDIQFIPAKQNGAFMINGSAIWQGMGDNVHVGELDGTEMSEENEIKIGAEKIEEFVCQVSIKIVEKYPVVSDNNYCGGANVTVTSIYQGKK